MDGNTVNTPGQVLKLTLASKDANFDDACERAYQECLSKFDSTDIAIKFQSYQRRCGHVHVYTFDAWIEP